MSRCVRDLKDMIRLARVSHQNVPLYTTTVETFAENQVPLKYNKHESLTKDSERIELLLSKYDDIIQTEWLEQTNKLLINLTRLFPNENYLFHFFNFWLEDFTLSQKRNILQLEFEIVCKLISGSENIASVEYLMNYVFWEIEKDLTDNSFMFIEYFEVLISNERSNNHFKQLLSTIKLPQNTLTSEAIQCCLSMRAFTLASIWNGVGVFYKNLIDVKSTNFHFVNLIQWKNYNKFDLQLNLILKLDFKSILNYWMKNERINIGSYKDKNQRNLLMLAVSFNSVNIVKFLLDSSEMSSSLVNASSDSGNTALHNAICQDNLPMVKLLIQSKKANVNCCNHLSDGFTPLHMATMFGHADSAKYLLDNGADKDVLTTSNLSAMDLAKTYQQTTLTELLN